MGVWANFPLALATGLGINAVVAFSIAVLPKMAWQDAMGIVVLEGIIITILVLTVLMGEPDEVQRARDELARLTGEEGRQAESQIFSYLPKVSGETRTLLVELVLERGAADRARDLLHSWSSVRRCRGAYRLGALHRADAVPLLIPMLKDRTFLVRRVALRALGSIGDPTAVVPILRGCGGDDRLTLRARCVAGTPHFSTSDGGGGGDD